MATTLEQVKTRVRERIDKTSSTYLADSELTSYINASYAELYDLLVGSFEDYFITGPTTFSLASSDTGIYALPATFYKLKGVDFKDGGDWITLYPFNWNSRNASVANRQSSRYDRTYRIVGSNLRIEPDDAATGDYRYWYVPSYTPLVSSSDVIDSIITRNNWEEYIVIDAGIKILSKEESSTTHLDNEKAKILKRIENMAGDRDVDQPESVSDVRTQSGIIWGGF